MCQQLLDMLWAMMQGLFQNPKWKGLQRFIKECRNLNPDKDKKGFDTGLLANHPFIK